MVEQGNVFILEFKSPNQKTSSHESSNCKTACPCQFILPSWRVAPNSAGEEEKLEAPNIKFLISQMVEQGCSHPGIEILQLKDHTCYSSNYRTKKLLVPVNSTYPPGEEEEEL
ncbi:hypothetical protein GE061_005162 [Apolygus lucorum]|uniref:Uncharacterized protein n=1 Tax=Apolygus lucorum TaxID=248454 RepID=A0A8S9WX76_APOLU|nr:hypothetical protein GE061_005162 [Apolygus lucorum]